MRITNGVKGFYRIEAFKIDGKGLEVEGSRRELAPWFPNLILESGLEYMGTGTSYLQHCQVGSGSTPPIDTQTALVSRVAGTNTVQSSVSGTQPSAPYFGWLRKTFRFGAGIAAGNLTEVGVGWATSGSLFSRALILDPGGTPTTISVGADEGLDVTYELRIYPPTTDSTGTVNISGTNYNWIARAAAVTSTTGWVPGSNGGTVAPFSSVTAYTGGIGPVTGLPSGTTSSISGARGGYASSTKQISITLSAALNQGNMAGGIKSLHARSNTTNLGSYQIEFDNPLPKDNTKVFSLTFTVGWARQP